MQFVMELWKPILLSGLAVWIISALVWTVMPHHKKEFAKLPNEDAVGDALRASGAGAGLYALPWMGDPGAMSDPECKAKMERGPIAYVTIAPPGMPAMGPMMMKTALTNLLISVFIAYVCWHTLAPGTEYLKVFRIAGTIGFMTYSLGTIAESIWFARPWKSFALQAVDALVYGLVIGGIFGWLWP